MALNKQFVDIDFIIERVYRRYGFEDINKSDVAEAIWDIIGLVHTPDSYTEEPVDINVVSWQGNLPTDFVEIVGVIEKSTEIPLTHNPDTLNLFSDTYTAEDPDTDPYTYQLKSGVIWCGIEETIITMIYRQFPIDSNGMPLVPDDAKAIRAVRDHVAEQIAFKLMLKDRLPQVKYDIIAQQTYFAIASFRSAAFIPNYDQLERIKNRYITLLRRPDMHDTAFKWLGSKTKISYNSTTDYDSNFVTTFTLTSTVGGETSFARPTTVSATNLATIAEEGTWIASLSDINYDLTYTTDISYSSVTDTITYVPNNGALSIADTIIFTYTI